MNDNEFEALVEKIQSEFYRDAKEVLGTKGLDRWSHPKFRGSLVGADGYAKRKGS